MTVNFLSALGTEPLQGQAALAFLLWNGVFTEEILVQIFVMTIIMKMRKNEKKCI